MSDWYKKEVEETFNEIKSSPEGLTSKEAKSRFEKYGPNIIKETHKFRPIKILLEQFNSFLIYILLISTLIMAFIGNYLDAVVIFAILILNGLIGFFQQYKAEKAIQNLKKLIVSRSKVIRDGKLVEILSSDLVPGDVVLLSSGDKVPADARIFALSSLEVNEAILTGESMPVEKISESIKKDAELPDRKNMLFMGTQIINGECKAVIINTNMETVFGKIAGTLQEIENPKTPMQKRLDKFSKQLGIIIIIVSLIVMALGTIYHEDTLINMFIISVTLAIGAIPEGLPAVLAIAFSISSVMLSKRNVIVRKLPAVETLGSVTVICSDKTGTITEEKMTVQEVSFDNKIFEKKENRLFLENKKFDWKNNKDFYSLLKTSLMCNDARYELDGQEYVFLGDPTEEALIRTALDFNLDKKILTEKEPKLKSFEFDSHRKMMSKLRLDGKNKILYSKGAPNKILDHSSFELLNGKVVKLTIKRKEEILHNISLMEEKALRVLAFAYKPILKNSSIDEENLIFQGFIGMIDPPRKEVKQSIQECMKAGIDVKIVTGDSAITAKAIAKQVGITGKVVTEQELSEMSDAQLFEQIDSISIFARASPHDKLRIIETLKQKHEVVAVTGDGINDVLALKAADIGIAMGKRGTDVARDVSDIVLIDDNFVSLVEGVKQGRITYDNVKKFTKYILSVNLDNLVLVALLSVLGFPLPLTPLLILWKNLITDSFPALTLVFEKGEDVMHTKPRREKSLLSGIWKFIIFGGILNFSSSLITYFIGYSKGLPLNEIQTMVVSTGIIFELMFVYTCRTKKPLHKIGFFSNKWLNYSILLGVIMHLVLLYSPLGFYLGTVPLNLTDWFFVIPLGLSGLIIAEIAKYFYPLEDKDN